MTADEPESEQQWLIGLRNSGSYKKGMQVVRERIESVYDMGAIAGASQGDTLHDYYIEVARKRGCKKGTSYADGPVKACHEVSKTRPHVLGDPYKKGKAEIASMPLEAMYRELVRKVLFVIYDYGYVQGMKHSLRSHNDELRWAQTYYRSCVARANDAEHEPVCAKASKGWADAVLIKLRKQIESHGLPAGKKLE